MKVFFDTNVYVAEALLGDAAARMLEATSRASWRIFISPYTLDEIERVMVERLRSSRRFALLTRKRARRRAILVVLLCHNITLSLVLLCHVAESGSIASKTTTMPR